MPDGESGEVVATLFNPYYAMIRFGVGDLSSINPEPCACGRTSLRLNGWQGRVGAATKVRGMFLHPTQLAQMMGRFSEAAQYQAVITRENHRDFLTLRVVLKEGADVETAVFTQTIKQTARDALKFRLDDVKVVPLSSLTADSPPIQDGRNWD